MSCSTACIHITILCIMLTAQSTIPVEENVAYASKLELEKIKREIILQDNAAYAQVNSLVTNWWMYVYIYIYIYTYIFIYLFNILCMLYASVYMS